MNIKRKKMLFVLALVTAFAATAPSCGRQNGADSTWDLASKQIDIIRGSNPGKNPSAAKSRTDSLIVGTTDFNGIFNPLWAESTYDIAVSSNIFGTLIEPDFDAKPVPGLADYKISEDGLTITLTLKKGVRFSDGKPVTSKDIEFTYYILCDPSYDGPVNMAPICLTGYGEYNKGNAASISGIRVIDDATIEFRIEKPNAQAIWAFSSGVLSRGYYGAGYSKGNLDGIKALDSKPMGAGPYKMKEFKPGESVSLEANAGYYKGALKIPNIVYSVIPSGQELERVKLGEVDIDFPAVNGENIQDAKNQGFIDIYRFPTNGYGYVGFRDDDPRFSDKRVRQALLTALDRKAIVASIYGPYANIINIPQSRVSWAYTDEGIKTYDYDLAKAAVLLKEAGWEKDSKGLLSKNGQEFKITFSAMQGHPVTDPMLPVMKEDYAKLGIDLEIEYLDWPALMDKVSAKTAEMWFLAWGLTPDPDPSGIYMTGAPQNYYDYSNSTADALMRQAVGTSDINKRKDLYRQIYQIINDDVPCLWVYQRSDMWVVNSRVQNFRVSPYRDWFYNVDQMTLRK